MNMDERKFRILEAIIDDYIMTAVPVGSRTISKKSGVGFSPATIRNEMSDLEELGYLAQPHTSAGRIPSAKAYRLYVDRFMKLAELTDQETGVIRDHLSRRTAQVEEVIRQAAQALSDTTHYTAVISTPRMSEVEINRLQLVPVSDNAALLVIVTTGGMVKQRVVSVPEGVDEDRLWGLSKRLTTALHGLTLQQAREQLSEMFSELGQHSSLMDAVLGELDTQIEGENSAPIVVGGRSNLLNLPEYSDMEKARSFLAVLESQDKLAPLLRNNGVEFTVRIGPENNVPELSDCSVITASYRISENTTGTMGIIGPTRMNYAKVVSIMNYMGKAISEMLKNDELN